MIISKIAITGGPCAGKTTAMQHIKNHLTEKEISVIIVPETATELINAGLSPAKTGQLEFQKNLLHLHMQKEKIYERAASLYKEDTVIIFDRGALDGKAYIENDEFNKILDEYGLSEESVLKSYDAVIFLESSAKDFPEYYTVSNNSARSESADEASKISDRTLEAWKNHNNLIIIRNYSSFEEKLDCLISEIDNVITKNH